MRFPTITVPAHDVQEGDYIAEQGEVTYATRLRGQVVVQIGSHMHVFMREEPVAVHLEDNGKEESC